MCGCGKKKVTQQQVDVQVAMIEQARAQTTNLAHTPRSARRASIEVVNTLALKKCVTNNDCPSGEVCFNGQCRKTV